MTSTVAFIVPVYNEAAVLPEFFSELTRLAALHSELSCEFVFVDDGSQDESYNLLKSFREQDERVTIISLSANRGQQLALTAGLDYVHHEGHSVAVLMDADMQDPPHVAFMLIERVLSGVDIVYAQRRSSNGKTRGKRLSSDAFYTVLGKLSAVEMPSRTSDFRAVNSAVIAEVVKYREHSRFLRGIFSHVGFTQEPLVFDRPERAAGESKYSYVKLMKLALDAILGYSTFPLRVISTLGVLVSFGTLLFAIWIAVAKIIDPSFAVYGWASTALIISFFAGLQLLTLGIMGSYIGRIYIQTLNRPLYSIRTLESSHKSKE